MGPFDYTVGVPNIAPALAQFTDALDKRREKNLLTKIGEEYSVGDPMAAQRMAFASGKTDLGLKISELSQAQKDKFRDTLGGWAQAVSSPDEWQRGLSVLGQRMGEDLSEYADFETGRKLLLAETLGASGMVQNDLRRETTDIARDRLALDRERLDADKAGLLDSGRIDYRIGANGTAEFIPGGPADPAVIEQQARARGEARAGRPLPQTAINKLTESGATFEDFRRLGSTFQDRYAGSTAEWVGSAENWLGRNTPFGDADQAQFWQDYQNQKNLIRNQLFGSALTATEKAEFDRANINPGQTPETIRRNVERQTTAAQRAARKLANVYIQQGYGADVIEAAIGLPLADLGLGDMVAAPATRQGSPAPASGRVRRFNPQTGRLE